MFELARLFKISVINLLLSRWIWGYLATFFLMSYGLFAYSPTLNGAMVSYMNVVVLVIPLMATLIGSMYYYNNSDFTLMMLTQPIGRMSVLLGQLWGLMFMLSICFLGGTLLGIASFSLDAALIKQLIILLVGGIFLTGIFSGMAYMLAVRSSDKLRGLGSAIFIWLFMAIIYDGLLLAYFYAFGQYPVENHAIAFSLFNPIDLTRVLVMLQMDVAALLGYTGAIFKAFFGTFMGKTLSLLAMVVWVVIIHLFLWLSARKKDF